MVRVAVAVFLLIAVNAFGQGTILFDTRVPGQVHAKAILPDGVTGFGAGWTAQLFAGPVETSIRGLIPLFPTTRFKTSEAADLGYVEPVVVTVPQVPPGGSAIGLMRVYQDGIPRCIWGETAPIFITLGGNSEPPAVLTGLQGFSVAGAPLCFIPVPSTFTLVALGIGTIVLHCRTRRPLPEPPPEKVS